MILNDFGMILGRSWDVVGMRWDVFGMCLELFGVIVECFWDDVGIMLASGWHQFNTIQKGFEYKCKLSLNEVLYN